MMAKARKRLLHQMVTLRGDLRSGELALPVFAADFSGTAMGQDRKD